MDIIFDFDGTLADGCGVSSEAMIEMARGFGYSGSLREGKALLGDCTTDFEVGSCLGLGDNAAPFTQKLVDTNAENISRASWDGHTLDVLKYLSRAWSVHVLSNRDQESLNAGVRAIGCQSLLKSCVGVEAGVRGKPYFDLYHRLTACWRLGPHVFYIGDKNTDAVFARKVGFRFIGSCWYRDTLKSSGFWVCTSLVDLPSMIENFFDSIHLEVP